MSNSTHSTPPPAAPLTAGQKFAGCYVLKQHLSDENGTQIWLAEDEVLGEAAALHFLPLVVSTDAAALDELKQEAKRNRQLIHAHILRVHDVLEDAGRVAIVTNVPAGKTLAMLLRDKGRFTADEVKPWIDQLARTLEEAHRIHFVAGSLAPEHIFLDAAGKVTIAHFGLSKIVGKALLRAKLPEGVAAGALLSPQLLSEQPASRSDDVYALAALIHRLVSGAPLFEGEDVSRQVQDTVPKKLSEFGLATGALPSAWDEAIAEALSKTAEGRPQTPAQLLARLAVERPATTAAAPAIEEAVAAPAPVAAAPIVPPTAVVVAPEPPPKKAIEILRERAALAKQGEVKKEASAPAATQAPLSAPAATAASSEPPPKKAAEMLLERAALARQMAASKGAEPSEEKPKRSESASGKSPFSGISSGSSASSRPRVPLTALVGAAVLIVVGLASYYFSNLGPKPQPTTEISTRDLAEGAELTTVKNSSVPATVAEVKPVPTVVAEVKASTPAPATPAVVLAAAGDSPRKPSENARPPVAPAPVAEVASGDPAAALEKLRQAAASAEKTHQELVRQQKAAEAAAAEAQKAMDARSKTAGPAAKAAEELMALRTRREEEQKAAEAAAREAQEIAAEKAKAAEAAKKAVADLDAQNKGKIEAQQKAQAEVQALQRSLQEKQQLAADSAKAVADAEATRQQYAASLKQTEQEVAMAREASEAAAAEAEKKRQAMDSERRKVDDELASMRSMFEQKMKELEERRKQIEAGGSASAPAPSVAPPVASAQVPVPMTARATPSPAGVAPLAMKADPVAAPATIPEPSKPTAPAADAAENSLGMRFVTVGPVQFCIWQTRVMDFDVFARAVNLKTAGWKAPGFKQTPEHPVVNVSWNEAVAFCKWLTEKERKEGKLPAGQFYRLPYDLEWSQAVGLSDETGKTPEARDMGVPDIYPWGTAWPPPKGAGNYTGEETNSDVAIKGYDDGFAWTAPVGSFPPNQFGIHDMGGNVWQWCMDSWNGESKAKVLRGASWYNGALKLSLLSSCRVHASPDSSTDNYGFRIVRVTEPAKAAKK